MQLLKLCSLLTVLHSGISTVHVLKGSLMLSNMKDNRNEVAMITWGWQKGKVHGEWLPAVTVKDSKNRLLNIYSLKDLAPQIFVSTLGCIFQCYQLL